MHNTPKAPPSLGSDEREEIARVIDPEASSNFAFTRWAREFDSVGKARTYRDQRRNDALAKADAILAIIARRRVVGDGELAEAIEYGNQRLARWQNNDPDRIPKELRCIRTLIASLTPQGEALEETSVLLGELIDKDSSHDFYGINGGLLGKLRTIAMTVRRALATPSKGEA